MLTKEEAINLFLKAEPTRTVSRIARTDKCWYLKTENTLNHGKPLAVIENNFFTVDLETGKVSPVTILHLPNDLKFEKV